MKKYTLYLGLNDKDTKTQLISTLESYKMVANILKSLNYDGATIFEAVGLYKHEDGTFVTESTLRIEILDFNKQGVNQLVETLKSIFNQESIAVQQETITSTLMQEESHDYNIHHDEQWGILSNIQ